MLFGRRSRSADRRSRPGVSLEPRRVVIITDLHVDFTGAGPMAAAGADASAVRLADFYRHQHAAFQRREPGALAVKLVVEGRFWSERPPFPSDSPFPPHCEGFGTSDLAAALVAGTGSCHVWETCPACGGDLFSAQADGKGQSFSLGHSLDFVPLARVDVAGLSAEHGAVPVAEAVAARYGPSGTATVFWPDLSTFLHPEQAPGRLERLETAGVIIERGDRIS